MKKPYMDIILYNFNVRLNSIPEDLNTNYAPAYIIYFTIIFVLLRIKIISQII